MGGKRSIRRRVGEGWDVKAMLTTLQRSPSLFDRKAATARWIVCAVCGAFVSRPGFLSRPFAPVGR